MGIGMPGFGTTLGADHPILAAGPPTNQQILDATKQFYGQNQQQVDTTTTNTSTASKDSNYVSTLNSNDWKTGQPNTPLTQAMQDQTSVGLFDKTGGGDGTGQDCTGLFGPTLCETKASGLFSTVSVGVSAELVVFVGGYGGLGCAWDIAKREGPKGYGFATAELGLKVAADINVQAAIFNQLPSQLNENIFGLNVGIYALGGASFTMFYTDINNLTILGYAISIGVGMGGGAAVFGGHIWSFG
jgi:NAD kinase